MRVLRVSLAAVVTMAAACSTEEPWPVRPSGGGQGGTADAPDADPYDAEPVPDDELLGRVCVVRDFQLPFACADIPLGRGVEVRNTITAVTAISGNDTNFTMAVTTSNVTLEVGTTVDLLHPTQSVVTNDSSTVPADVAAFEQALWDDMLATLVETETTGALVIYVRDSQGDPIPNATVSHLTPPGGQRTYYDDGVGGWDGNETVTGPDGIALLLDSSAGVVSASAPAFQLATIAMPSRIGAASIGVITLPAAP